MEPWRIQIVIFLFFNLKFNIILKINKSVRISKKILLPLSLEIKYIFLSSHFILTYCDKSHLLIPYYILYSSIIKKIFLILFKMVTCRYQLKQYSLFIFYFILWDKVAVGKKYPPSFFFFEKCSGTPSHHIRTPPSSSLTEKSFNIV